MTIKSKLLFTLYLLLFTLFTFYSYSFLDTGLTLTSFKPYLDMQKTIRHFGYFNKPFSTMLFILLSGLLFAFYSLLLKFINKNRFSLKNIIFLSLLICIILIFAYPSFSHDVFNYIFNAKMVLIYHADPHRHSAWEFKDPMLDFMRNVHTPAPYFYGWTVLSLLPFIAGLNRIFTELISFKVFSIILFYLTYIMLKKLIVKLNLTERNLRSGLFLLNPLILIEAIGTGHNDFAMMAPILASFYFLIRYKEKNKTAYLLYTVILFLFSISTKYATGILIPIFFIWWYFKEKIDIGKWGAVLLFLLPFILPLDQLHSWYFIWPLSWILLSRDIRWVYFFYFLSFFSLLRYFPYIWYGNWDPPVSLLRIIIYFILPAFFVINRKFLWRFLNVKKKFV